MQIKIFKGSVTEERALESKINTFLNGKTPVQITQSIVQNGEKSELIITVLHH